jgi:hypothetical protein
VMLLVRGIGRIGESCLLWKFAEHNLTSAHNGR